jgi:RNA recognition motif 2
MSRELNAPPPGFSSSSAPTNENSRKYFETTSHGDNPLSMNSSLDFNRENDNSRSNIVSRSPWNDPLTDSTRNWDTRTTSFTNLAAMIGKGLAESMEDSTQDSRKDGMLFDLNYARQTRHAASRLLGSSGLSPTAALLDLSFPVHPQKRVADASLRFNSTSYTGSRMREPTSSLQPTYPLTTSGVNNEFDPLEDFRSSVQHRNHQLPMGIFHDSRPTEVGVTVMEPDFGRMSAPPQLCANEQAHQQPQRSAQGTPSISRQGTPDTLGDLHRGIQAMTMDTRSVTSSNGDSLHNTSEIELESFLWDTRYDEPSRTLAILRAYDISLSEIRLTCETFGVLEIFRADFAERGIIFASYFDIRSAQNAALGLKHALQRLKPYENNIDVKYCVPLNSSSAHDESIIILSDLPRQVSEMSLMSMLSTYGSVRSFQRQPGSPYSGSSFIVEFNNTQDAKLTLLELENAQPWGQGVVAEVGLRSTMDRRRGKELLNLIASWRHSNRQSKYLSETHSHSSGQTIQHGQATYFSRPTDRNYNSSTSGTHSIQGINDSSLARNYNAEDSSRARSFEIYQSNNAERYSSFPGETSEIPSQQPGSQLVLGPDGRYSYVVVNHAAFPPSRQAFHTPYPSSRSGNPRNIAPQPLHPHFQHQPHTAPGHNGSFMPVLPKIDPSHPQPYWNVHPHQPLQHSGIPANAIGGMAQALDAVNGLHFQGNTPSVSQYAHVMPLGNPTESVMSTGIGNNANGMSHKRGPNASSLCSASRRTQHPTQHFNDGMDDKDNKYLTLDISAVDSGRDSRTSLMVRNIPNKYTQQMLLSEFTENGHGPGKIDFFYLPIDFKNRCNRGYAFINFVDYKDISSFHRQYSGQHWKVFNSDKICDITYARIQGKASMLKRFENSALMEKDEEYKPLVFVSHGIDKGKRLPFPTSNPR